MSVHFEPTRTAGLGSVGTCRMLAQIRKLRMRFARTVAPPCVVPVALRTAPHGHGGRGLAIGTGPPFPARSRRFVQEVYWRTYWKGWLPCARRLVRPRAACRGAATLPASRPQQAWKTRALGGRVLPVRCLGAGACPNRLSAQSRTHGLLDGYYTAAAPELAAIFFTGICWMAIRPPTR